MASLRCFSFEETKWPFGFCVTPQKPRSLVHSLLLATNLWPFGSCQEPPLHCQRGSNVKVSFKLTVFSDINFSDSILANICITVTAMQSLLWLSGIIVYAKSSLNFAHRHPFRILPCGELPPKGCESRYYPRRGMKYVHLASQVSFQEDIWTGCEASRERDAVPIPAVFCPG